MRITTMIARREMLFDLLLSGVSGGNPGIALSATAVTFTTMLQMVLMQVSSAISQGNSPGHQAVHQPSD